MMRESFAAFRTMLAAVPGIPAVDDVARVTDSGELVRANYVIAWPPKIPDLDDERYTALQRPDSKAVLRFDVRPVATTADGVLLLADRALSLIGQKLTVEGRSCDPFTLVPGVEEGKAEYDRTARLYYVDFTLETVSRPL